MKQRIISALVMVLICLPLLILGGIYFKILVTLLAGLCLYEFLKYRKVPIIIQMICYFILINNNKKYNYEDAFYLIGIIVFLNYVFKCIIDIRNISFETFFYLLLIAVSTDTFALLIGKSIGSHKLAPKISPNKTIEGSIGGTLMGMIIGTTYYGVMISNENIIIVILVTLLLSIIGQMGDLVKSSMKRCLKIKDFSNLIPGHGGVLDRLDSIIFISITYMLIIKLL